MFKYAFNALIIIAAIYFIADAVGLDSIKNIMIFFAAIAFLGLFS